tara:strand:+ start:17739 stop:18695 length:957 start_codon:yes stop_codon:yes gene_type:complete
MKNSDNAIINLLYCFDEGYNLQTYISIKSILSKSENLKYNILIIHKNPNSFSKFKNKLLKEKLIENIYIWKFNLNNIDFPNVKNKHISEATYYRLYFAYIIQDNFKNLIYLDSDVFAVNNPEDDLLNTISELENSKHAIAASSEQKKNKKKYSQNLIFNDKYFNAGVMAINVERWKSVVTDNSVKNIINKYSDDLKHWDQDVLNLLYNGEYLEMSNALNYRIYHESSLIKILENSVLIHYFGNHKPWTIEGGIELESKIYFEYLKEFTNKGYHFVLKSTRKSSLIFLFNTLLSRDILKVRYPMRYFFNGLRTILFKNK